MPPIRAALFVDFDQVFGALHRIRPEAALAFATQPGRWLEFFEDGLHAEQSDAEPPVPRSVLVRRCYLNPVGAIRLPQDRAYGATHSRGEQREVFGNYRVHFTRAAFSVIDCPPLTSQGKNSADIVMVMDILDILNHQTRFDEFIILSSDADFTPVLLKLRMHDRRTTILADQLTAAAYRNACDHQVQQADFIEQAIGMEAESPAPRGEPNPESDRAYATGKVDILDRVAQSLAGYLRVHGRLQVVKLTPVFMMFPEFTATTPSGRWFGHGSLNRLVLELARRNPAVKLDQSDASNMVAFVEGETASSQEGRSPPRSPVPDPSDQELHEQAHAVILQALEEASEPIVLASLAQKVLNTLPGLEGRAWLGAERFASFLRNFDDPRIAILPRPPGYAYDPVRNSIRSHIRSANSRLSDLPEPLRTLAVRVVEVSNCPALKPNEYHALFVALAGEIERLSTEENQNWGQQYLATCVYERCAEQMLVVTHANVAFVLAALEAEDANWRSDASYHDPRILSKAFCDNLEGLCETARFALTNQDRRLLEEWICGEAFAAEVFEAPEGSGQGANVPTVI